MPLHTKLIIGAQTSPENVAVLPALLDHLRRKLRQVSADGAYDTKACHKLLRQKHAKPTFHHALMTDTGNQGTLEMNLWMHSRQENWINGN
ncbi:MAG: hypothetical protein SStaBPW_06330 [Shewanella algae]